MHEQPRIVCFIRQSRKTRCVQLDTRAGGADYLLKMEKMMTTEQLWAQVGSQLMQLFINFSTAFSFRLSPLVVLFSVFILVGLYIRRAPPESFFAWAFPKRIYKNPSLWVDLMLLILNYVFGSFIAVYGAILAAMYSSFLAQSIQSISGITTAAPNLLVTTVMLFLAKDFAVYFVHRFHHANPMFWPIHSVHHSAEELSPITAYRHHPLYLISETLGRIVFVGTMQGVLLGLFFDALTVAQIAGTNLIYAAFVFFGSNFRHSHIWLPFWRPLEYVFISPSMHQIHHSKNPIHFNKNYGEVFAIWDWFFGTLYLPQKNEVLEFGLANDQGVRIEQPHPTIRAAIMVPLTQVARRFWRILRKP